MGALHSFPSHAIPLRKARVAHPAAGLALDDQWSLGRRGCCDPSLGGMPQQAAKLIVLLRTNVMRYAEWSCRWQPGRDDRRVRLRLKRAAEQRPGSFPASRPADLEAFGLRTLDAVGTRLALLFLVTALAGIPLGAGVASAGPVVAACTAVLACMLVVAAVLAPGRATPWALAMAVAGAATTFLLAGPPAGITWDQSGTLAAWVVAGLASGVAAARGPAWGLAVSLPVAVTYLLAGRAQ